MKHHLSAYLDNAIAFLLFVVAGLTPLLFINQTTEFYDTPKLLLLIVATVVLFGMWIFSWILKGKIVITKTPLDMPLVFLLVVVIASTYFSTSRFSSIYGNLPNVHGSAVAWITYILLYFVTVSHLKDLGKIRTFLFVIYGSSVLVSLMTILSFFGIFLPLDFAKGVNFTPTGSSFSTIALLVLLLPYPLLSIISPNKYMPMPFAMALALLFGVTITLIGSLSTFIVLAIAVALVLFVTKGPKLNKALPMIALPIIVVGLIGLISYLPVSLPAPLNKMQQLEASFPKEIQLPYNISWKISASAFRDAPFVGTGPSTYLFNFTTYKPAEFNTEKFWNFSFDTAYNEFLQVLGTLGVLGLISLSLMGLVVLFSSWRHMSLDSAEEAHDVMLPALSLSGILSIILLAVHAATLVSIVVTLFLLAALMMSQKSIREKVMELSMGIKASTGDNQFDLLPVIIFVLFLIGGASALWQTYNAAAADVYHRLALRQASKSGTLTYEYLQKAESMNPFVDLYRVDMAQTNFALANAIAAKSGIGQPNVKPTPLSDRDKQTIQTLLSQSINEGRVAVALSPRSARNWEVLASIYRNITGVSQNALAFALDGYGRSIQRDPLNPALRVSVGGIYYSVKNYDLAIRFFSDAANLKPDYANAYYNLSLALRDKGDLQNAKLVAEQTVILFQKDTNNPDYKTAVALLNDLKEKAAAGTAQTNAANAQNSALTKENVSNVNVQNLNNPPQPATPAAVKKNPNANIPALTPAPTVTP